MTSGRRRSLATVYLCLALLAGVWPILVDVFVRLEMPAFIQRRELEHDRLECFATGVLARTAPGSAILFNLPPAFGDGGLVNHRLRYVLPGRRIVTNLDSTYDRRWPGPDYRAVWNLPAPPGQVLWRGCGGTLYRERR